MSRMGLQVFILAAGALSQTAPGARLETFGAPASFGRMATRNDGSVWFPTSDSIARVSPNGVVTTFGGVVARGMALAPDGDLWFSFLGDGVGGLGRLTASGAIALLPPVSRVSPGDLAIGGDGCVWAAEERVGEIWRVCPSTAPPTIVRFSVGGRPRFVARGGDGNIWFTDGMPGTGVRRITPLGGLSTFGPGLDERAAPGPIASDGHGNLWFVEAMLKRLGRLEIATGQISEVSLPASGFSSNLTPTDLVSGNEGNVYFSVASDQPGPQSQIGVIVNGALVAPLLILPPGAAPWQLALSPLDDLWANSNNGTLIRYRMGGREPLTFIPLSPCRAVDTRNAPEGSLSAFSHRLFVVSESCGIPRDAKALATNVTVTGNDADGDLRIVAGDAVPNVTTVLSFRRGRTRANNAHVSVSRDGSIIVENASAGNAHVVLDVAGYYR